MAHSMIFFYFLTLSFIGPVNDRMSLFDQNSGSPYGLNFTFKMRFSGTCCTDHRQKCEQIVHMNVHGFMIWVGLTYSNS